MNKQGPQLEWELIEDDARWAMIGASSRSALAAVNQTQRVARRLASSFAIFLLLASIGSWWYSASSRLPRARVAAETGAVAVTVAEITPDTNLPGPARRLQTPSFVLFFRQEDAATVVAVAPQIETYYTALRSDLGLVRTPGAEKLVIEVSAVHPPGMFLSWAGPPARLVVPAPARYEAPGAIPATELLAQAIVLPLIDQTVAHASEQHAIRPSWRPLMDGLRLWQLWQTDLPLAVWQDEVVRWLVDERRGVAPAQSYLLPEQYTELCAMHRLFVGSPTELNIPLLCADAMDEVSYDGWGSVRNRLVPLNQLVAPARPDAYQEESSNSSYETYRGKTVLLATLIDYAVTTYGREHLPELVAGLAQHDSWENLLPAVYGVPASEFEAGWRADLAAQTNDPVRWQSRLSAGRLRVKHAIANPP